MSRSYHWRSQPAKYTPILCKCQRGRSGKRLFWKNESRDLTASSRCENMEVSCKNGTRMKLKSIRNLLSAIEPYGEVSSAIAAWCKVMEDNDWKSPEDIRQGYSKSVDRVCGYTIFNIKGNQYRLIVQINYSTGYVLFKKFLTHAEYSKINWNDENEVKEKIG
ncbi:type II toxin-antitoxin system HigB family toxin [Microcoleus sp. CZ3-B2]|uniref:type II toxin-antitoxin system HigB family toxin n=2 Tax=unclassified Microcoleus TaxID=2642155 RepID=UPI002FD3792F